MAAETTIFIGCIIHCIPSSTTLFELDVLENGYLVVQRKKILDVGKNLSVDEIKKKLNLQEVNVVTLTKSQLLIPGLIDTHIHAPQYPNVGLGYDKPLLEWLDTYTYKLEKQYKDLELSKTVYDALVKKTLSHGTTTACYFASLFDNSSLVLVDAAIKYGQRALIGKINMIRLAPDDYIETAEESIEKTKKFIKDVKSKNTDLVKPVITPRFALSVDMDLMQKLGQIAKDEDLHIQTHISENKGELEMVEEMYHKPYATVYDEGNLLTPKTVLAHGVLLTDDEIKLLASRQTSISHCPASNTCLKSGLCDVRKLMKAGVTVGLGTDVSGGPSPSIIEAMRQALDTSIHLSFGSENYETLNYIDVFHLATLHGAKALALDSTVGNFEVGKDFDALIVDANVTNSNADCFFEYTPLELLQKFIFVGDNRNVRKTYVAGRLVHSSDN